MRQKAREIKGLFSDSVRNRRFFPFKSVSSAPFLLFCAQTLEPGALETDENTLYCSFPKKTFDFPCFSEFLLGQVYGQVYPPCTPLRVHRWTVTWRPLPAVRLPRAASATCTFDEASGRIRWYQERSFSAENVKVRLWLDRR